MLELYNLKYPFRLVINIVLVMLKLLTNVQFVQFTKLSDSITNMVPCTAELF